MSRIEQVLSLIALLDATPDEDYPSVRATIIAAGELPSFNSFSLGLAQAGYDPLSIDRASLRSWLTVVLQIGYVCAWVDSPAP